MVTKCYLRDHRHISDLAPPLFHLRPTTKQTGSVGPLSSAPPVCTHKHQFSLPTLTEGMVNFHPILLAPLTFLLYKKQDTTPSEPP